MNEKIQKDLYRYVGNQCKKKIIQLRYIFFTPGFTFIWAWRHAKLANNPISKLFWRIIHLHFSFKYGIQIPYRYTHEELAGMISSTRSTVSRKMKLLQEEGFLTVRKRCLYIHPPAKIE